MKKKKGDYRYFYLVVVIVALFFISFSFYTFVGAKTGSDLSPIFGKNTCEDSDNTIRSEDLSLKESGFVSKNKNTKEAVTEYDSCQDDDKVIENYCNNGNGVTKVVSCSRTFGDGYVCLEGKCENLCGNGNVDSNYGEECDDGNSINEDGCSSSCLKENCGDGIIQENLGEQCDDGNSIGGDGCGPLCYTESCGDEIIQGSEECDDGNNENEDGCSSSCLKENCGDGIVQEGLNEECDGSDFNGKSCSDYGMSEGSLECNSCSISSSGCSNPPA